MKRTVAEPVGAERTGQQSRPVHDAGFVQRLISPEAGGMGRRAEFIRPSGDWVTTEAEQVRPYGGRLPVLDMTGCGGMGCRA